MFEIDDDTDDFEIEDFRREVQARWTYQGQCNISNWSIFRREDAVWQIEVAPVFQEIYSGDEDDGKKVWVPFEFDLAAFMIESGVDVDVCGVQSFSAESNSLPCIGIVGAYRGKSFALRIHLEPIPNTAPIEVIDRIKNEVRNIAGETS